MDQGVRVVLALGIVTAGTAAALLFRHPAPPTNGPAAGPGGPLVLRGPMGAGPVAPDLVTPSRPRTRRTPADATTMPRAAPVAAGATLDAREPPPLLAESYPEAPLLSSSRWGTSMAFGFSGFGEDERSGRTHKIVDGDTLDALAERYLGSADRAAEIYRANQHLLPSPDMLPIGVELQIPPRESRLRSSAESFGQAPLVPIPPRDQRRP